MIKDVFQHAEGNKAEFTAAIIKALMELQREDEKMDSSPGEMQEFADFISREISNKTKQLAGEDTQVRFSPYTINLAMNVYLQSCGSFEDLRQRSLTALPCVRYLQKLKSSFHSTEGDNPACYAPLLDTNYLTFPAGHLCVDEVTIKSDLVWNVKNNEITGFCNIGTSPKILKEQLKSVLANEDDYGTDGHAVMCNQWRFRSVFNEHYTSEFFFNNGSLDSDEMMRQLLEVLTNFESIGVAIHGVCCDGGGANEGVFGMFRAHNSIKDNMMILGKDDVAMTNPCDTTRVIWFWNCQVHNLKNCRNAIWRSYAVDCRREGEGQLGKSLSGRKKCLMCYKDKAPFGWQGMEDSYARQRKRVKDKAGNMPLSYQAVNLDGLTLMQVSLAKAAFAKEVLAEITDHCRNELVEELKTNDLDPEREEKKGYNVEGRLGAGKRFLHYAHVFRKAIPSEAESRRNYKQVKSDICLLEYLSVMHTIFIERFVNKEWSITSQNIDEEIAALMEAISVLGVWQEEKSLFKGDLPSDVPKTSWQRHVMAWKTFRNLRVGISGFFGYARDILNRYGEKVFYVPAHHSNQSMIEAYFSKMRAHRHDYTSKIAVAAKASNAMSLIRSGVSIVDVENGAKHRQVTFDCWSSKRVGIETVDVPIFPPNSTVQPKTAIGNLLLNFMKTDIAEAGFVNYLLGNTRLADYARLSIGTQQEMFFKCIIEGGCEDAFNAGCQKVVEWSWHTLDNSLDAPNNSPRRLYFYNLHERLVELNTEKKGNDPINNNLGWSIVHIILSKYVLGQVKNAFDTMLPATMPVNTVDCLETVRNDVNRFAGWSLFSIRHVLMKGTWSQQFDEEDKDTLFRLLDDMSTKERDIVSNKNYIEEYYPFIERINNEGGLTLWSPKYIKLGFSILKSITKRLSFDELRVRGNAYSKVVRKEVVKEVEKEMLPTFLDLSSSITGDEVICKRLLFQIVDKTFHCRTGAFLKVYKSEKMMRGTTGEKSSGIREILKHATGATAETTNT